MHWLTRIFQKLCRGWSDDELDNLDQSLARLILPRLIRFQALHGHMVIGYTDLNLMIFAFTRLIHGLDFDSPDQIKRVQEGLDLFAKHYRSLWF